MNTAYWLIDLHWCSRDRNFEIETLLKLRDQTSQKIPRLDIWKFVYFSDIKIKLSPPVSWTFSNFWHFSDLFWLFLTCKVQIQQRKSSLNYRSFTKPYYCDIQSLKTIGLWPRPVAFVTETESRPETFETDTRQNGSRDETKSHCWFIVLYDSANNQKQYKESSHNEETISPWMLE